jgi:hypothetical protein
MEEFDEAARAADPKLNRTWEDFEAARAADGDVGFPSGVFFDSDRVALSKDEIPVYTGRPDEVGIFYRILGISEVNSAAQTARLEFILNTFWFSKEQWKDAVASNNFKVVDRAVSDSQNRLREFQL